MATLTVQAAPARTGLNLTTALASAAGGGDKFANGPNVLFVIVNGDSGSHVVTFAIQKAVDGVTPAGKAVTVAAGKTFIIGPFDPGIYNDSTGFVDITYDGVTSVTVAAFTAL